MQSVKYHKEGIYRYMVLEIGEQKEATYVNYLFQYEKVPNFLQYELRTVDDQYKIYYRLQYKNSLQSVREFLSFKETGLYEIIDSIIGVLETARDYLLDCNHIIWSMECIFIEVETNRLLFCYYPDELQKNSMQEFFSEFMQLVGKKNEQNVVTMLQFYHCITEPSCSMESILAFRNQHMHSNAPSANGILEIQEEKENGFFSEKGENLEENRNPSKKNLKRKGILFIIGLCDVGIFILCILNILPFSYIYGGLALLGIFVAGLFVYEALDKEEDNPDKIMEDYFKENPPEQEKTIVYGETSVLLDKDMDSREVVVEDSRKELYLMPLKKDEYEPIYIEETSIVIGCMRDSCNYVINARGISRLHAKIMKTIQGLMVLDLNSTNGTFLNGEQIVPGKDYSLEKGDMIAFSQVEFLVSEKPF